MDKGIFNIRHKHFISKLSKPHAALTSLELSILIATRKRDSKVFVKDFVTCYPSCALKSIGVPVTC